MKVLESYYKTPLNVKMIKGHVLRIQTFQTVAKRLVEMISILKRFFLVCSVRFSEALIQTQRDVTGRP